MKRYFDFDMNDYKDKKCNFHSHTVRCQHAVGEEREYVEEAIKEGFEVIGFSDHSPYLFKNGYVSRIRMTMSQLEDYVKTIEALKKEYRDDIDFSGIGDGIFSGNLLADNRENPAVSDGLSASGTAFFL